MGTEEFRVTEPGADSELLTTGAASVRLPLGTVRPEDPATGGSGFVTPLLRLVATEERVLLVAMRSAEGAEAALPPPRTCREPLGVPVRATVSRCGTAGR